MTTKPTNRSASASARRARAVESFGCAADAIGSIEPGTALFCITRGQWSMIDAILHVLNEVGRSRVSVWTWTVAEYEVECLTRLRIDTRITQGTLVIEEGFRNKDKYRAEASRNLSVIQDWHAAFGPNAVRYVVNHAKIATIESESGLRCLLRGSMNLNFNPRFEQFDLTEGGPDFDLVRQIEESLPNLPANCTFQEAAAASQTSAAFTPEQLTFFQKAKVWAK